MTPNAQIWQQTIKAAKLAAANNPRWLAAVDKAAAGVESGWWIVTELADCVAITTECGKTYFANGSCQCEAYKRNQPCKHRALARLIDLYNEAMAAQPKPKDERAALIADIKRIWPGACPALPLETELMARFGKNRLEMLDLDMLRRVRLAIAL